MARWAAFLPAIAMAVLAVLFIVGAHGFKPAAASVPIIVGWTVLLLAAIEFASHMRGPVADFVNRLFKPTQGLGPALAEANPGRQAMAVGGLVVLVAAFIVIGMLPACAIFIFVAMRFGACVSWAVALVAGGAMAAGVWLIFAMLLRLSLPAGLLFDGGS